MRSRGFSNRRSNTQLSQPFFKQRGNAFNVCVYRNLDAEVLYGATKLTHSLTGHEELIVTVHPKHRLRRLNKLRGDP